MRSTRTNTWGYRRHRQGLKHNIILQSISLQKHVEADPDFVFTLQGVTDPSQFSGLSNLIRDNLIVQAAGFSADQAYLYSYPFVPEGPVFTDLSVKRNFIAEKDVEVSKVMPDSNFVTRPAGKTLLKEKTLEQKAEEAANFLIKIKKRRFKLVSGQYANMPGGEAISDALQELSKLEEEYLSLFIGKRTVTEVQRIFHYTPVAGKSPDRFVICRFSSDKGLVDAREASGMPVILELEAMRKTKELEIFKLPLKPTLNAIPYRIADQAQIKLLTGEQVWAEASFPVFQYGVNVTMNPNQ